MKIINLEIDKAVFNDVYYPYLDYNAPMEIFYGGSSSGKSYFLAQRTVLDVVKGGHNYLITRKVARTLRGSTFNEIKKAINFFQLRDYFKINESDLVITCINGYQILFAGLDDVEKVKSITPAKGVITDIWVEEATETEYNDVQQLDKRLRGQSTVNKRIVLSFNPIYQTHWIYGQYFAGHWADGDKCYQDDKLLIIKTTFVDNAFLTDDDKRRIADTSDKYYYEVYVLGNWGVLGKVIFTNWTTSDLSEQQFDDYNAGCDFGYAADPAALSKMHYDRKRNTLYIPDARYCYGYTNDLLASEITSMIDRTPIMCDCAEPKSIQELRQHGVNAVPAQKGKDSINFGIQWLQKLQIIIDKRLTECINEFTVYKWQEDKDGNTLPKPIDKNNHIIDSIRYALVLEMQIPSNTKWKHVEGGKL